MYKKFIDINLFFKLMTGDRVDSKKPVYIFFKNTDGCQLSKHLQRA